jgi:hypothetical protein
MALSAIPSSAMLSPQQTAELARSSRAAVEAAFAGFEGERWIDQKTPQARDSLTQLASAAAAPWQRRLAGATLDIADSSFFTESIERTARVGLEALTAERAPGLGESAQLFSRMLGEAVATTDPGGAFHDDRLPVARVALATLDAVAKEQPATARQRDVIELWSRMNANLASSASAAAVAQIALTALTALTSLPVGTPPQGAIPLDVPNVASGMVAAVDEADRAKAVRSAGSFFASHASNTNEFTSAELLLMSIQPDVLSTVALSVFQSLSKGTAPDPLTLKTMGLPEPTHAVPGQPADQERPLSCVLAVAREVIRFESGRDIPEGELRFKAYQDGAYVPDEGTRVPYLADLLKAYGVPADHYQKITPDQLYQKLGPRQVAVLHVANEDGKNSHVLMLRQMLRNPDGSYSYQLFDTQPAGVRWWTQQELDARGFKGEAVVTRQA